MSLESGGLFNSDTRPQLPHNASVSNLSLEETILTPIN